jgi:hypothetical protein
MGGVASLSGQAVGNKVAGRDALSNINVGAIVGASIGAGASSHIAAGLFNSSRVLAGAAIEGLYTGGGELLGREFSNEFGGVMDFSSNSDISFNFGGSSNSNFESSFGFGDYSFGE